MFLNQQWFYLLFFACFTGPISIFAQEAPPKSPQELPKEIITSPKESLSLKPELVKIIKKDDIDKDLPFLSQVLKHIPGIRINESGGIGQFASAYIRGSTNQQIKIYKNGIPIPENRYGIVDLSKISLSNIESIEIYKGFAPSNLGSSNMGAAINLITNKNSKENTSEGTATITYGSFDSLLLNANLNKTSFSDQINLNIDFTKSENNYPFRNDHGTPYNDSDDTNDHKTNNAFQSLNIQNEYFTTNDQYEFRVSLDGKIGFQELGGPKNVITEESKNNFSEFSFSTFLKKYWSNSLWWQTTFFSSVNNNILSDPLGEIGFSPDKVKNVLYSAGFKNLLHWDITNDFYSAFTIERKQELNKKTDQISNQISYWKRGYYQASIEPGICIWEKRFEIKTNVTFTYIEDNVFKFSESRMDKAISFFDFQFSAKYISDSNHLWKTSFGKVNRGPSLFELFGDTGLIVGNQNLKNESTSFGEISWEKSIDSPHLNLNTLFSLTGFIKKSNDLISYQQISSGIARPFNIDETLISGIETEILLKQPFVDLLLQYTFTNAQNKSNDTFVEDKHLPGIPRHNFSSEITGKFKKIKMFYRFQYSSKEYFDEINLIYENDRVLHDVGISFEFNKWRFDFEIKNLENKQYEDFVNYPLPGRSFWLKINYQF